MKGTEILFNNDWYFLKTDLSATVEEVEAKLTEFQPVEIPHDWLIYNAKDLYEDSCGWYVKDFELEAEGAVFIRFDGVYMNSTVYVNGKSIGDWKYGYSTFTMDISKALVKGKNEILVQVRHQSPNSRWYSGAGIYRNVWLKVCQKTYLPMDGTYINTKKCGNDFLLDVETEIAGDENEKLGCQYTLWKEDRLVQDLGWFPVVPEKPEITDANAAQWESVLPFGKVRCSASIKNPSVWDVEDPQTYQLRVELCEKDTANEKNSTDVASAGTDKANLEKILDKQEITVGFRTLEFTTDKGLFLNGRHLKIHGVCEHHDLGGLGAAFHRPAMVRKIKMLQKMGVNAIRTSHNMPDPEWMQLADEMGILILSEGFDMWERCKTEFDYGCYFKEWVERDVRSWVRRDRNHPSLLLWSIGNEIYDTHADEHGQEITRRLMAAVHAHDPRHNAKVTIGSNYMPWENAQKCADIVKVAGYNYGETCYDEQHKEHPDWIMYGSETASLVQSRGIYHFPYKQSVLCEEDEQCSSLGNSATSWGAKSWEKCITDDRDPEYIFGMFIWTGFDYIGEPTPYHTKNSYFGQIDTAGFPKDSYYAYKSAWTDVEKEPFVHVFPYWDFNPGQQVDIRVCSNAFEVELFVNQVSQGRKQIDQKKGLELIPGWEVVYAPGEITAIAYDADGREVARETRYSFGDSKFINLQSDKYIMSADGEDICFVEVSTLDENRHPVENAVDYVKAEITGPGRILAMDNGDSTDYDDYKTNVRKLFSGKLLIMVGNTGEAGTITLRVTGKNLETCELSIEVQETESKKTGKEKTYIQCAEAQDKEVQGKEVQGKEVQGKEVQGKEVQGKEVQGKETQGKETQGKETQEATTQACEILPAHRYIEDCCKWGLADLPERIPLRKLEMNNTMGRLFTPECSEALIEAKLYPANTTDTNLEWKAVNRAGVEVNFVQVEAYTENDKYFAKVRAVGDGAFLLRCMARVGERAVAISQLEFEAIGLGMANLNPYEFVSAGLFTDQIGEIGNGNEKGIATERGKDSGVVFSNMDFGEFGSDELTLSVFALNSEPYPIDIWLGKPFEEGSRILQSVVYQKPSIWNVYQEETYQLPERVKGLATIGFILKDKVHVKGFCFKKKEKAFQKLFGNEADAIYGDTFTREERWVRGIGNNVTIAYENMDFGEQGTEKIIICGRTPLAFNTIHVSFTDDTGRNIRGMMEFEGTGNEACTEQTFSIPKFSGKGKIEFVFLPGCDFDLESIQFLKNPC